MANTEKYKCTDCGKTKTAENFEKRANGVSLRCKECEGRFFERLSAEVGCHIALYSACAAFNVPFFPLLLPQSATHEPEMPPITWSEYLAILKDNGYCEKNGKPLTFLDGATNILKIFGRSLTEKDTAKYIRCELERKKNTGGSEEQRKQWGSHVNFTSADYDELDRQYENRKSAYKGMTLTPQMEDTLQKVCIWNTLISKYIARGEIRAAKDLQTMVETALASEQMRKKDERPVEALRIDALVNALENAGLMEDGMLLSYDEVVEVMRDKFCKSKKYDYSLDVADQLILASMNAMRENADLPILAELDGEYASVDEYGEFEQEETVTEKAAKRYAGLTKVSIAKGE